MTPNEFNTIKQMITAYWATLNLKQIKAEFASKGLLTQNKKLSKGDNDNWGLELLPSVLGPINTCPGAGKCRYTCLAFSGIGNVIKGPKMIAGLEMSAMLMSKARKLFLYVNDNEFFNAILKNEIENRALVSGLMGKSIAVRLNTTSDLDWTELTNSLPNVQFYDYTKVWTRKSTANYNLTFSVAEHNTQEQIEEKLNNNESVAIVFHKLPETYMGFPVVDGDVDDDRYNDVKGTIIGLKYKTTVGGKDDTSFVR